MKLLRPLTHRRFLSLFLLIGAFSLTVLRAEEKPVAPVRYGETAPFDQGRVASLVARLLEQAHISQKPFDTATAALFLKNYVEALDFNHMTFLQSDLEEFTSIYRKTLPTLTKAGNTDPAYFIYARYLQRLEELAPWIESQLKQKPDFTLDESFTLDRRKLGWPQDLAEAKELWRLRLKFELLQARLASEKEKPEETVKMLTRRYQRRVKESKDWSQEDIVRTYLTALANAYDPHSDYQSPREAKNFEITTIRLTLTGIGAVLRSEDGYAKIVSLVPGGPADLDKKLKPNDRIVAVKQEKAEPVNVVDMRLDNVVEMIRGEQGSKVTLTVIPADAADSAAQKEITLVRNEIQLKDQQAKARIIERELPDKRIEKIGVLILEPGFYDKCAEDAAKLIQRLEKEGINGLIVDLRRNGGGLLEQAIEFTGLFVKQGPVVQVKDQRGQIQDFKIEGNKAFYNGPLVVLTSKLSASAAEIVAAALQDYGRAIIVGDKTTHGKGTVQTLVNLKELMGWGATGEPGKLKVTVQKFYRIAGNSTQLHGVVPDIILPSIFDAMDLGEASLDNALPGDAIPADRYTKINYVESLIPKLQSRSNERLLQSKDFGYLNEEIALVKKRSDDKKISLNESQRRAEKLTAENRKDIIEKERAQRKVSSDKVYVLGLDYLEKNLAPKLVAGPGIKAVASKATPALKGDADPLIEEDSDAKEGAELKDIHLFEAANILHDYLTLPSSGATAVAVVPLKENTETTKIKN
jgi:carboxyl-terminal processing protease